MMKERYNSNNPFHDPDTVTGGVYGDFQEIERMHKEDQQRELEEDIRLSAELSPEENEARKNAQEIRDRLNKTFTAEINSKLTEEQRNKRQELSTKFVAHRPHIVEERGQIASDHYQKLLQEYLDFEKDLLSSNK